MRCCRRCWIGPFGVSCEPRNSRKVRRTRKFSCISCPFVSFVFQTALDEQRRIVAYLDNLQAQVDELTALQEATQAELDALLPSVLDRAFRGEL